LEERLAESLEQQAATAEVLRIISTSPTKLQLVLEVIVKSAARFCGADDVTIFELDRQDVRAAAHWGTIPQEIGVRFPCSRGSIAGRTILDRKPVHVIDLQAEADEFPEGSAFAKRLGHRTTLGVPLLREGVAIGTIQLRRAKVNPFTDKQIALLGTFADQAVIAIENVRLFEVEQQRARELSESLEQQTATSQVLQVISSSPGELKPVFQTMLANAVRICEAKIGSLYIREGDAFRTVATHNAPPAYVEARTRELVRPPADTMLGRLAATPMMALSGVRSSWLMLETNCDLFSLACCSCRFLSWISSNSRTFSMAITAWSAKVEAGTAGPPISRHAIDRFAASLPSPWFQFTSARPCGVDSAPYFAAFVTSSCSTIASTWVAATGSAIFGPPIVVFAFVPLGAS
jgi:hypothetical protein